MSTSGPHLSSAPALLLLRLLWCPMSGELLWPSDISIHLTVGCPAPQPRSWLCPPPAGGLELVDLELLGTSVSPSFEWESYKQLAHGAVGRLKAGTVSGALDAQRGAELPGRGALSCRAVGRCCGEHGGRWRGSAFLSSSPHSPPPCSALGSIPNPVPKFDQALPVLSSCHVYIKSHPSER